jgi:hypothetical protein
VAAINADPALLLHYTFDSQGSWDRVATNQAPAAAPDSHGIIHGGRWTEGRWPGKYALQFSNATDRVRLHLSQTFEEVTSVVWVRVDALPNAFTHSLITGDSEGPGTLRWTFSHGGNIRWGVANPSNGPEAAWGVGISPALSLTNILGRWVMISTVYSGGIAKHYLNAQVVWSGAVQGPERLSFGWAEVGNWVATPEHPDFAWAQSKPASYFARNFVGAFGQVILLSRALSQDEIISLYVAGQPIEPETLIAAD